MSEFFQHLVESKPLQAITSLGLGVVIAWFAFSHFLSSDKASDKFLRETLIKTMEKDVDARVLDAQARTKQAQADQELANAIENMAEQVDDVGDETRAMNKHLERFWTTQLSDGE